MHTVCPCIRCADDEPLGVPLGPMTVIDANLGIYSREFQHVSVSVNVSAWQGSVTQKTQSMAPPRLKAEDVM